MAITVRRDPCARGEYKRFALGNRDLVSTPWACDWCGQRPSQLYSYVWWSDGGAKPQEDSGYWFCNRDCFAAYTT